MPLCLRHDQQQGDTNVKIVNVTPILIVERIEPLLDLWQNKLGFEKVAEVPHEGQLGFVLLT
jgi:hypothetical protein